MSSAKALACIIFSFLVSLPEARCENATDPEACAKELRDYAHQENMRLPCETIELTKRIIDGQEDQVPEKIYHYGRKEFLLKDAASNTVPKDDWDNKVMSASQGLGSLRQGLYGTHSIDTNNYFTGDNPIRSWLMEIRIKPECRQKEKVIALNGLAKDQRFIQWMNSQNGLPIDLKYFDVNCSSRPDLNNGYSDSKCVSVVEKFAAEKEIKVILDFMNFKASKAFYLRDRDCIEGIRSTPTQLLEIFASNPALWLSSCKGKESATFPYQLVQGLLEKEKIDPPLSAEQLNQLRQNARLLPGNIYFREKYLVGIDAFAACHGQESADSCQAKVQKAFKGAYAQPR